MFDQDNLRALSTLLLFIAFLGVSINVFRRSRKAFYEEAAQLPFVESESSVKEGGDE